MQWSEVKSYSIPGSCDILTAEGSWHTFLAHDQQSRPACSFRSAQAATLLGFLVPLRNCFAHTWFCVILHPKPPLHRHNWLISSKFQDKERFPISCPRHVSSRLPPSGESRKYAMALITHTNLERFFTYWYAPFCCVCRGCRAAVMEWLQTGFEW
jgi:hypothetical protein